MRGKGRETGKGNVTGTGRERESERENGKETKSGRERETKRGKKRGMQGRQVVTILLLTPLWQCPQLHHHPLHHKLGSSLLQIITVYTLTKKRERHLVLEEIQVLERKNLLQR